MTEGEKMIRSLALIIGSTLILVSLGVHLGPIGGAGLGLLSYLTIDLISRFEN